MSERSPGFEEYIPSRLEWLVVMLNSHAQYVNTIPNTHVEYLYTFGGDGKTITMHIRHSADLPPESVQKLTDIGKNLAITTAKRYKWDSWINIETKFESVDRTPTKEQD